MRSVRSVVFACAIPLAAMALVAWPQPAAGQASVSAELQVGTGIEDREPVGVGTSFPATVGQLVAWSRITGAEGASVEHVWRFPDGDIEAVVPLEVGGSPWRTWSRKTIPAEWAGQWIVEVRDAGGTVLASANVTVGP